ncbi:2-succinylbenzoyl-CoA synthetase [Gracilibacillus ureilyticus]|uniref:2-succinylbenzoate--CoA ligase n=1 Tax=Gracilibacillus ureilyticus TaxID=531814 RepID=A0A1H9TQT8_9BACI|nr:o-succinylbenzoate--CoA ligase [Gracilibacillus ureilyticus]SER99535.1 2-succinylbenzoyl-CoA synthetase [Gracilibacillus ureilyticus]
METVMEHWLTKRADLSPDMIAVEIADGQCWTFEKLYKESVLFAKKLANYTHHIKHIGILSNNSLDMIVAFFACTYLEKPVVLLNTRLTTSEIKKQCQTADVELILTSDNLKEKTSSVHLPSKTFTEIHKRSSSSVELTEIINMNRLCSMMFTSGTTGNAKAVMHSFDNHWSSAVASALNLGLLPSDKWLACLPLYHISGLAIIMKSVIYGMSVFLLEKFDELAVQQAIMKNGVTIVSVVAVTCSRLLNKLGEDRYPPSFRCMLLGGGPAPVSLLKTARDKGIPIIQTYGMTETSSQIATLNERDALERVGSAGKALFSAQIEIRQDGAELAPAEIGEIVVNGPMVTAGYYNHEEANKKAFYDGWLYTGDLGYKDEQGFLYVIDRRSDLIISGGENIYPAEIEDCLLSIRGVEEAGVAGMSDPYWGQVPAAFIVRNNTELTETVILDFCKKELASYKIPKKIYFVRSLPRNATSKLQRHKLWEWMELINNDSQSH